MSELNYVCIGPAGTFQKSGKFHSLATDVDKILQHLEESKLDRVGLYLHGGLVDEDAGMDGAKRFATTFSGAGLHGISLVWKTGWWETIQKNLESVFSTDLFKWLVEKATEKVTDFFAGMGARGPGGAGVTPEQIAADRNVDATFSNQTRARAEELSAKDLEAWRKELIAEVELDIESDDDFQELYVDPKERPEIFVDPAAPVGTDPKAPQARSLISWLSVAASVAKICWNVGKRFWGGRDHGIHATVVEEVFREFYLANAVKTLAWDNMKQAAREMWRPNTGLTGDAQHAGTYLLEKLIELKKRRPALTVDIVAHSAGAIVTCELFAAMLERYPGKLPIRNVIFLAPAVTSLTFHANMLNDATQFSEFYMFTMPDELERADAVLMPAHALLSVVYPSSLLYVVSGMLEDEIDSPVLGMVRYGLGKSPFDSQQLMKVKEYMGATKLRLIQSAAKGAVEPGQLASRSISHGGFSSDQVTMESIQVILKRSNAAV